MALKRHIGFWSLFFAAISASIGSGWLFAPFYTAKIAGPLAVIAWPIAGLVLLPILYCFISMARLLPVTGGLVRFLLCSHGSLISFICSWLTWLAAVFLPPIEVEATIQYSAYFYPGLMFADATHQHLSHQGILIAIALLFMFVIINGFGVRLLAKTNAVISLWKLCIPVIFIMTVLTLSFHSSNFHSPAQSHGLSDIFIALSTGGIIFSLIGFRSAIEMSGEVANPRVNIPRAILLAFVVCTLLYTALQVAFIGGLSAEDFAQGWARLTFAGEGSPLVGLAASVGLIWLVSVLYIDAMVSPSGTGLLYTASNARVLYAISAEGFFPKIFSRTNRYTVPIYAILLNFVVGLLLFLPFSGWREMVTFLTSLTIATYSIGAIAKPAIMLNIQGRTTWWQHAVAIIALLVSSILIYYGGWRDTYMLAILCGAGTVLFLLRNLSCLGQAEQRLQTLYWFVPYVVGMVVISYLGTQGGIGYLSTQQSLETLAVLSIVCYFIALQHRLPKRVADPVIEKVLADAQ